MTDRLPPHSKEAELAVLAGILKDPEALPSVLGSLAIEDFYFDAHQRIYQIIRELHAEGQPIELVAIHERLKKKNQAEDIGGYKFIVELWESVPTGANVEYHASIVTDAAMRRRLIRTGEEILKNAQNPVGPAGEIAAQAEVALAGIAKQKELVIQEDRATVIVCNDDFEGLDTTCLSDIEPEPVRWLVPQYIPLGKMVLIAGDGGHGKSFTTLHMAAMISTGRCCFGLDYVPHPPAEVLLISCEDDFGDTVVPRLLAAGADLRKIHRVNGIPVKGEKPGERKILPFSLAYYEALEHHVSKNPNIKLVVIDPAGAYIGSTGVDDHKDSDLRSLLGPLSDLGNKYKITIVLVKHLNKGTNAKAVNKVSGGAGYVNAVRAAYLIAPDPTREDESKKLFLPMKFNIVKKPPGLKFHLEPCFVGEQDEILSKFPQIVGDDRESLASQLHYVKWDGMTSVTADNAVAHGNSNDSKGKPSRVKDCADWMPNFMGHYSWPDQELMDAGDDAGFGPGIMRRTKTALRAQKMLRSRQEGVGGLWWNWIGDEQKPQRPARYVKKTAGAMAENFDTEDATAP